MKAKRARVAAHVRTKATNSQWEEFALEEVRATVEFTRELIESKLAVVEAVRPVRLREGRSDIAAWREMQQR